MLDGSQEGDHAHLRARIVRAVRKACPADMADMAEDIAHVTLMRILESYRGSQPPSDAYLRRAAHNGVIDEVRRRARERQARTNQLAVVDDGDAPGDVVEQEQLGRAIQDCLQGLPSNRRVAVTLNLLGLDHPSIASRMQWDARQVRNNLHRGFRGLRACLDDKGFAP